MQNDLEGNPGENDIDISHEDSISSAETESIASGEDFSCISTPSSQQQESTRKNFQKGRTEHGTLETLGRNGYQTNLVLENAVCSMPLTVAEAKMDAVQNITRIQEKIKKSKIPQRMNSTLKNRLKNIPVVHQVRKPIDICNSNQNISTPSIQSFASCQTHPVSSDDITSNLQKPAVLCKFNPSQPIFVFQPLPLTPKALRIEHEDSPENISTFASMLNKNRRTKHKGTFANTITNENSSNQHTPSVLKEDEQQGKSEGVTFLVCMLLICCMLALFIHQSTHVTPIYHSHLMQLEAILEEIETTESNRIGLSLSIESHFEELNQAFQSEIKALRAQSTNVKYDHLLYQIALLDVQSFLTTNGRSFVKTTDEEYNELVRTFKEDISTLNQLQSELDTLSTKVSSTGICHVQPAWITWLGDHEPQVRNMEMVGKIPLLFIGISVILCLSAVHYISILSFNHPLRILMESIIHGATSFRSLCSLVLEIVSTITDNLTYRLNSILYFIQSDDSMFLDGSDDDIVFIPQSPRSKNI